MFKLILAMLLSQELMAMPIKVAESSAFEVDTEASEKLPNNTFEAS